jgi:hypothetical protein
VKPMLRTLCPLLLFLPALAVAQEVTLPPRLTGHFEVASGPATIKDQTVDIHLVDGTNFLVRLGDRWFAVTRPTVESDTFKGKQTAGPVGTQVSQGASGALGGTTGSSGTTGAQVGNASIELKVIDVRNYEGKIQEGSAAEAFTLTRRIMIPPANLTKYDTGPRGAVARHKRDAPAYPETGDWDHVFWIDWGPVFYRGRLNGKARVLGIASDPGPTESLPFIRRSLVGDAGQRTQGFLEKIGITKSYVLVNAYTYPTHPSRLDQGRKLMKEKPEQAKWRHDWYDLLLAKNKDLEAIALFGGESQKAFRLWNKSRMDRGLPDVRTQVEVVVCAHPSSGRGDWDSVANKRLASGWKTAVTKLRSVVTPDDPKLAAQPNFGLVFSEVDYAEIPPGDLPKGAQKYPGIRDNSWSRTKIKGRRNNSVRRYGSLNMQFNRMDGTTVWIRVVGRNPLKPNNTPRFKTFADVQTIARYAVAKRFGKDSPYLTRLNGASKTRHINVLKTVNSSRPNVVERMDKLLPPPTPPLD